jgi:dTDP-4-dehydrorhamnose reductase
MKTILVTGSNGLLGQKLTDLYLEKKDRKLIASGKGVNRHPTISGYIYEKLDICNPVQLKAIFEKHKPDVVINAAAMTQVDDCESQQELCKQINIDAVKKLATICSLHQSKLIHISTDFIFDGQKGNYTEEDTPNPLSYYGWSKLEGEKVVQKHAKDYAILRTVLVYGVIKNLSRSNIVLWAVNALKKGVPIKVVNDQWRTPTLAEDLATGCYLAESKNAQGIFNISGKDLYRIDNLVRKVGEIWGLDTSVITEVSSEVLNQPAKRPPKTGFDISKARGVLGYEPRSFEEGLLLVKKVLEGK